MKTRQTKTAMARLLLESLDSVLSGEVLARELHVSRQSVWKIIRELEDEGFEIEPFPQKGYRLRSVPSWDLAPSFLGARLPNECPWGKEIHVYDTLPSTQSEAKRLGRSGGCDGLVVVAEEQTRGRGRRDRVWFSPRGTGLYFSVYYRPRLYPGWVQLVNLAAGLAVMEGVEETTGLRPSLKWPNDLLLNERKICGILSEASSDSEAIRDCCTGIGINISLPTEELSREGLENAGALSRESCPVDRGELLVALLPRFAEYIARLESSGADELLARYRERCSTLGREVTVHTESDVFTGTAAAIGESGELILSAGGERRTFFAADVVHATSKAAFQERT